MRRFTFKKDGSNCINSNDMCSYGGCIKGHYIYIGELVDSLAKYEDLEDRITKEFGSNLTAFELMDMYLKQIETQDGEALKGFRILTNDDALLYDEWKNSRNEPKIVNINHVTTFDNRKK